MESKPTWIENPARLRETSTQKIKAVPRDYALRGGAPASVPLALRIVVARPTTVGLPAKIILKNIVDRSLGSGGLGR